MRAKLHRAWPALAYHFQLYPDDTPRFSVAEWNGYLTALAEIAQEAEDARRKNR